jgi:hypothetical protein
MTVDDREELTNKGSRIQGVKGSSGKSNEKIAYLML